MDVKPLSEQERSDFDEAWAKFAYYLMRSSDQEGSAVDIGEAAVRLLKQAQEIGLHRIVYGGALTIEHLAKLGPRGVAMAGIGLASKSAQVLTTIMKLELAAQRATEGLGEVTARLSELAAELDN